MTEQANTGLSDASLKLLTFAGPLFATSLAIAYDVGFFAGIGLGFFSFFNLSEHLVFALQALPFAVIAVIPFGGWFIGEWLGNRTTFKNVIKNVASHATESTVPAKEQQTKRGTISAMLRGFLYECLIYLASRPRLKWVTFAIFQLGIFLMALKGQYAAAFLMLCADIYANNAERIKSAYESRSPFFLAGCLALVLVLSFIIGFQRADSILDSKIPAETIVIENSSLPARLIRGGDKGVLFFSLDNKTVRFLRWDAIKQIETLQP